jgi:hypothetical protein
VADDASQCGQKPSLVELRLRYASNGHHRPKRHHEKQTSRPTRRRTALVVRISIRAGPLQSSKAPNEMIASN